MSTYEFVCVSAYSSTGLDFASEDAYVDSSGYEDRSNPPVTIEWEKEDLAEHITKQGYDLFGAPDSHKINEPQSFSRMHEMEFRMEHEQVKSDPARIVLHFDRDTGEDGRAEHARKYGSFKALVYDLTHDG